MSLHIARTAFALSWLLTVPVLAGAQSTIAGEARDATGAVLPGVTVEAASEALSEKVRTATTDRSGTYRIVDLRPGVYTVTFSLPGFAIFRQERVALPAEFTATVNAELKVGALQETVTDQTCGRATGAAVPDAGRVRPRSVSAAQLHSSHRSNLAHGHADAPRHGAS